MDDEQDRKTEGVIQLGRGLRREMNKEEEEAGRAIPHPFSGWGERRLHGNQDWDPQHQENVNPV